MVDEVWFLPELEVWVDHPVGETFTANTDAFKHTVTGELMHHKMGVDETYETKVKILKCNNLRYKKEQVDYILSSA